MHHFFTTLRFRLTLLVFLAVLPALALSLYSGLEQRRIAVDEAKKDVQELVVHALVYQEQVVEETRQLLFGLSELPMVQRQDGPACAALFARILEKRKFYANISAISLQGMPFASALPQLPRSQLGRNHFERALQTRDFAIGEFGIGRASGKPTLHFGYPIIDNGVVQGVVSASIDLYYLNTLMAKSQMPPGAMLTVIDRDATILARYPQSEQWVGKRMPEAEIVKIVLAKEKGVTEAMGIDGVRCLFSFAPLSEKDLFIYAGVPLQTIYAEAQRMLARNIVSLGVAAVLALALAWLLGQWFLINRTRALVNFSQQLAGGDLAARSGLSYDDGEFGHLAQSFDEMATALRQRDHSLRESQEALENANIQLKALVQEGGERNSTMALLNDMSEMLQTCQTSEEAFSAINHFVPKFFPNDAGALYHLRNSKNLLSAVTTWGDAPAFEELFPPDDCWAVRSGRLHWVDDPDSALFCKHITAAAPRVMGYLCVPLMAQGVSLGILHIRFLSCATWERKEEDLASKQRLAAAIAENLALSLANLKLRETLQNQAIRDPLTGLYNRRYLDETLDRELHRSRRLKAHVGVVMMDLDHFKDFNDAFGHGAGDELLSAMAHVITDGIRSEDIACRYGGEEFLLVLPGASLENTRERAENIRQAVTALQVKYHGRFLKSITISLGVATFPDQGNTAEDVISAADAALYRAKQAGRDRVEIAVLRRPEVALSTLPV